MSWVEICMCDSSSGLEASEPPLGERASLLRYKQQSVVSIVLLIEDVLQSANLPISRGVVVDPSAAAASALMPSISPCMLALRMMMTDDGCRNSLLSHLPDGCCKRALEAKSAASATSSRVSLMLSLAMSSEGGSMQAPQTDMNQSKADMRCTRSKGWP